MANLIIPAGAAFVGGWLGGPTGAALGWSLGSALTAESTKIPPPAIGDLRIQGSGYGEDLPIVVGQGRLAGKVVWKTDKVPVETKNKVGKGGGVGVETVTITYTVSMAIKICEGPILGIKRMWADGVLLVDGTTEDVNLPGTLYLGSHTQNVDPTIEAHEGVGNAHAMRGWAYIVLTDYDLGVSGRVPNFSFEVIRDPNVDQF